MRRSIQREAHNLVVEAQKVLDQAFGAFEEEQRKGGPTPASDGFLMSASDRIRYVLEMAAELRARIEQEVAEREEKRASAMRSVR